MAVLHLGLESGLGLGTRNVRVVNVGVRKVRVGVRHLGHFARLLLRLHRIWDWQSSYHFFICIKISVILWLGPRLPE